MTELRYFEDITPGSRDLGDQVVVDGDEMLAFARQWDPVPIHVDPKAAEALGGLTAPGLYILALKQRLIHRLPFRPALIGSAGYDEVRFFRPVFAGDRLTLAVDWLESRHSRTKEDRGVVIHRLSLLDDQGETVMSHLDTLIVRRRTAG
ncbi:MaoC/PaaZ C-terminal domain-containing protein [Rhizobium sp. FKY42]|uniref:MaoC/PaaZ C-terminal domain-containing protein n=1 Tax=Rhizobium sp. FKY42 TaxID=2562310 RepID=UPI0010BF6912|nr:MaoC/PaaZ C-terminal domain-containing protein [Rhizobium sp. FKY42]